MNIDEREQLSRFLEQLAQTQAIEKDGEADALIRATCARQTDAAYLLVQRAMLLEAAVRKSQDENARLQGELEQARSQSQSRSNPGDGNTRFIDANAWGNSPAPRSPLTPQVQPAQIAPPTPAQSAMPATSAWGSGMLGNMATTAAGVVAGGFLFQGIGHLLGSARPGLVDSQTSQSGAQGGHTPLSETAAESSAGLFDISSVDDFIASDADGNV